MKALSILGTSSGAGKNWMATAFCAWLRQEGVQTIDATIRRDNMAKLDHLPLIERVASAPELKAGQRIRLAVASIDYLTLELGCRYLETLDLAPVEPENSNDDLAEAID